MHNPYVFTLVHTMEPAFYCSLSVCTIQLHTCHGFAFRLSSLVHMGLSTIPHCQYGACSGFLKPRAGWDISSSLLSLKLIHMCMRGCACLVSVCIHACVGVCVCVVCVRWVCEWVCEWVGRYVCESNLSVHVSILNNINS